MSLAAYSMPVWAKYRVNGSDTISCSILHILFQSLLQCHLLVFSVCSSPSALFLCEGQIQLCISVVIFLFFFPFSLVFCNCENPLYSLLLLAVKLAYHSVWGWWPMLLLLTGNPNMFIYSLQSRTSYRRLDLFSSFFFFFLQLSMCWH